VRRLFKQREIWKSKHLLHSGDEVSPFLLTNNFFCTLVPSCRIAHVFNVDFLHTEDETNHRLKHAQPAKRCNLHASHLFFCYRHAGVEHRPMHDAQLATTNPLAPCTHGTYFVDVECAEKEPSSSACPVSNNKLFGLSNVHPASKTLQLTRIAICFFLLPSRRRRASPHARHPVSSNAVTVHAVDIDWRAACKRRETAVDGATLSLLWSRAR
jgi:hypothetical protein